MDMFKKIALGVFLLIVIFMVVGNIAPIMKEGSDDIAGASFTITNESVTLDSTNTSGSLEDDNVHDTITAVTDLRNNSGATAGTILGKCNVTLTTGAISCNNTDSNIIFLDYTSEETAPDIPLTGLFSYSGIIWLMMMAVLVVGFVGLYLSKKLVG